VSDLDALLGEDEEEPATGPRGRAVAGTFLVAVVAAGLCVVLLALLLYGLGTGGAALWDAWWDDFA
jgi:hypothetical protein